MPLGHSVERMAHQENKPPPPACAQLHRQPAAVAGTCDLPRKGWCCPKGDPPGWEARAGLSKYLTSMFFSKLVPECSLNSDPCSISGVGNCLKPFESDSCFLRQPQASLQYKELPLTPASLLESFPS